VRLVDNLRKAEKKSAMTIRRGVERAREEWADLERRLRQRMRIYPQKPKAMAAGAPGATTIDMDDPNGNEPTGIHPRTPIVSVHGQDLNKN
jgi:extradiol dioxygenase family protein